MSFMIKNDDVLNKYNDIRNKIKKDLNIKFHSIPVYDKKYIKAMVREFGVAIKTKFSVKKYQKKHALHFHFLYNY